jgi:SAM-dependent methyltransferase
MAAVIERPEPEIAQPAGEWWGADPRYRGYRPTKNGLKLDHRVRVAIDMLPPDARRVLDLGAGDAVVSAALARSTGAKLGVSLDIGSPPPLCDRPGPVSLVTARLPGPLPFPDGAFDVVVALEVIEHLIDPDAFLDEIVRVLAPGGAVILSTPRLDSFLVVASLLMGVQPPGVESSPHHRYGSRFGEGRPSGHVHLFTKRAMVEALDAHGLQIDRYREGRFSSSWWQAVRSSRRPGARDLAMAAGFKVYDAIPFRKDVMVLKASRTAP